LAAGARFAAEADKLVTASTLRDSARRIAVIIGTRPEAVKLARVVDAIDSAEDLESVVVVTAQHRRLLDPVLERFELDAAYDLDIFRPGLSLDAILARSVEGLGRVLAEAEPHLVIVEGDTTTTLAGALAALHAKIPVGHVEAGLRTKNLHLPWPEEANRRAVTHLSTLHFAPTGVAAANLAREGIDSGLVFVTGNPVIDALQWCLNNLHAKATDVAALAGDPRRKALVTLHRRESWGAPMTSVAEAIADLAREDSSLLVLFPVHRNPTVRESVERPLLGIDNVRLIEPLEYPDFVHAMAQSSLILTDSGGVQEEAPSLCVPVLVLRDETDRPDSLAFGARVVGTSRREVHQAARSMLDHPPSLSGQNPFGDGKAASRIVAAARNHWGLGPRPEDLVSPPVAPA
jgi:UDP-N-acetylglucosamine 2-epimerase (non-hydrolysing)